MQHHSRDRLQPSLIDRLMDQAPDRRQEGNEPRMLSRPQLRAAVLRDLGWLFNAIRAEPGPASRRRDQAALWKAAPEARRSVLNYGMPAFSGMTLSGLDARAIERSLAEAIRCFEPRIDGATLEVGVKLGRGGSHHNTLAITIRGHLWSQPVPMELLLAADMDMETGHTRIRALRH